MRRISVLGSSMLGMGLMSGGCGPQELWQRYINALSDSMISYLTFEDSTGPTAIDKSSNGNNAAYPGSGITYGEPGIAGGGTCVKLAGSHPINWWSTGLRDRYNGQRGGVGIIGQMSGGGVWTDGATRSILVLQADTNNRYLVRKSAINNELDFLCIAGGVNKSYLLTGLATAEPYSLWFTWSKPDDKAVIMWNGAICQLLPAVSAVLTGIGTWAGQLASGTTSIGSAGAAHNGWVQHAVLTDEFIPEATAHALHPFGLILFEGDSRTAGKNYPVEAYNLGGKLSYTFRNQGHSGYTLAQMIANYDTNVRPWYRSGQKNIIVILGGLNDAQNNADAATIWARQQTLCNMARAQGWKVILCSEIDAQTELTNSLNYHTVTLPALLTLQRNGWQACADGFADLVADARLMDATNTTYFSDGAHPTTAGYSIMAGMVGPVIASL